MPTISRFFGILIQMNFGEREHPPPHFHAIYGEYEAKIGIVTLEVLAGELPRRALALVLEWAAQHRQELLDDWELAWNHRPLQKIPPPQVECDRHEEADSYHGRQTLGRLPGKP